MFGKSKTTKTKSSLSRPAYYTDMLNSLSNDVNNIGDLQYINQNYSGLNNYQNDALQQLIDSNALNQYAGLYNEQGLNGLNNINSAYNQLQNTQAYTTGDIENLASQFYNYEDVQNAINASNENIASNLATSTLPTISEQYGNQAGMGSGQRMAKSVAKAGATSDAMNVANQLTDDAYNSAIQQADNLLSNNQAEKMNALGGLYSIGNNQAQGLYNSANTYNQANQNALYAGNIMQQDQQNSLNNDYNNQLMNQNIGWQDIQNRINAASVLNGGYGQNTTTYTKTGGGMLGGIASGAAAGSAFGPWGALAGGAIGGVTA